MRLATGMHRAALAVVLLLVAGCSGSGHGGLPVPSTSVPATAASPAQPKAGGGLLTPATAGKLIAHRTSNPPMVDGSLDAVWAEAEPLQATLTRGIRGTEHALDVELQALYTPRAIYFLVQWANAAPIGPADTIANKLTVHWQIDVAAGSLAPACKVACHTAYVDGWGRLAYIHAETIPPGGDETLQAAGSWQDGIWTLEWSRPLVNENPYDLQFADLNKSYPFFVKVFERLAGRPDPVSAQYELVFQPLDGSPTEQPVPPVGSK